MKLAYKTTRAQFYDNPELVRSLRATLAKERHEHKSEVDGLRGEIAALRIDRDELSYKIAFLTQLRSGPPPVIDREKYGFPRVLGAICKAHNVTSAEIKSQDRRYYITRARMHLINIMTVHRPDLSTTIIGKLMNRDHTTVINARYRWPHISHKVAWAIAEVDRLINNSNPPAVDSEENR